MLLSRPCRTTRLWSTGSGQKGCKKGLGQKPFLSSQAILAQKPCGQAGVGDPHGFSTHVGWRFQRKKVVGWGMRGFSGSLEEGGMPLWVGVPHRAGEGDRLRWGEVS